MRRFRAAAAALWLVGLSGAAWGADLKLSIGAGVEYDDNIRRTDPAVQDDVLINVSPKVQFIEDEGKLNWDLLFQMPYRKSLVTDTIDELNYLAKLRSRYRLNDRTRLSLTDSFSYSEAVTGSSISDPGTAPTVSSFREPVFRNNLVLGLQHAFTPRLDGNLSFTSRLFRSDLRNRADNEVWGGNANVQYTLSPRHFVGGGVAATYQDFARSNNGARAPSQTLFVNLFGSWVWQIDETTSFEITAGPTFVTSNQDAPRPTATGVDLWPNAKVGGVLVGFDADACPILTDVNGTHRVLNSGGFCDVLVPVDPADETQVETQQTDLSFAPNNIPVGGSDSTWTIFGEVALNKRWTPTLDSSLVYSRTDSTASGIGSSATLDLISFLTTWRMAERWRSDLRADFTYRESVAPLQQSFVIVENMTTATDLTRPGVGIAQSTGLTFVTVQSAIDTIRWGVSARIERQVTKHIFVAVRYLFNRQESAQGSAGRISDFNDHIVGLSVQYDFDRWRLW